MAVRCAIVPPTPVPYREPLFSSLHKRDELDVCVIYQSAGQPSWDVPPEWFPREHAYPAVHLRAWQRRRPGRTPVLWPHGLERALNAADPDCVVVSEYGRRAAALACRRCARYGTGARRNRLDAPALAARAASAARPPRRRVDRDQLGRSRPAARVRDPRQPDRVALQAGGVERPGASTRAAAYSPVNVLSAGRLVPDKNFATLIEAFSRIGSEATLEIVGAGFLEDELKQLATRLGVSVRFPGHVPPSQMPSLYAAADVYALVSTYEPFGVAVREAAAAGLPIICSKTAGAAGDVAIDCRNALLVNPYDVDSIVGALERLVADADLRRRMGEESRAIDLETEGSEVDAFVDAVLRAAVRRGRARPPGNPYTNGKPPADYRPSRAGSTSS